MLQRCGGLIWITEELLLRLAYLLIRIELGGVGLTSNGVNPLSILSLFLLFTFLASLVGSLFLLFLWWNLLLCFRCIHGNLELWLWIWYALIHALLCRFWVDDFAVSGLLTGLNLLDLRFWNYLILLAIDVESTCAFEFVARLKEFRFWCLHQIFIIWLNLLLFSFILLILGYLRSSLVLLRLLCLISVIASAQNFGLLSHGQPLLWITLMRYWSPFLLKLKLCPTGMQITLLICSHSTLVFMFLMNDLTIFLCLGSTGLLSLLLVNIFGLLFLLCTLFPFFGALFHLIIIYWSIFGFIIYRSLNLISFLLPSLSEGFLFFPFLSGLLLNDLRAARR